MKLEYISWAQDRENKGLLDSEITQQQEEVRNQVLSAQNSAKLDKYLSYIDRQLLQLQHINKKRDSASFSLEILALFSPLFQEWFWYDSHEKKEIMLRLNNAIWIYHKLFPKNSGQKYFRGHSPATLLILWDTWYIWFTEAWKSGYKFI